MKKINSLICIALAGLTTVSCEDFLTLKPLNDIVLENFWTDKSDVESVLLGAYAALETSDCLVRMSIWGEMRSDNIVAGNDPDEDIRQITRDNIMSTNSFTTYKCFYDVINRANTVLHFAPQVAEKDPNYTQSELRNTQAEAIALRSLSYWYLIRAYRDVPYTTIPSIDDTHDFFIPQTKFNVILDSLISDLEFLVDRNYPVKKYATEGNNTIRFRRVSILAMLADMYLWHGDWDKCINVCDEITAIKLDDWEKLKEEQGVSSCTVESFNGFPLISETPNSKVVAGNAYKEIFGTGNSFESLFELPYDQTTSNPFVSSYYNDRSSTVGSLKAATDISSGYGKESNVFSQPTDGRYFECVNGTDGGIIKYVYENVSYNLASATATKSSTQRNTTQPNWVIYRYSDVLLMQAEAYTMKAADISNGVISADSTQVLANLEKAFKLVDAVNGRAVCTKRYGQTSAPSILGSDDAVFSQSQYANPISMEELVLQERRRELMFEGKRWFDMVRATLRDVNKGGNTDRIINWVGKKHEASTFSAVKIKLKDVNALFFPINKDEIKINPRLVQNPVYVDDEYINKAK